MADARHPRDQGPEDCAVFDAYLANCHAMLAEARAWAGSVPESVATELRGIAIVRDLLEAIPRMPGWMAAHLNGARPAIFRNPDGSETEMIEWPFSRHFRPDARDDQLFAAEQIAAYRHEQAAFFSGIGKTHWLDDDDPAADRLETGGLAALLATANLKPLTRAWKADAAALIKSAGAGKVAAELNAWLEALGPADAHRAATPIWPQVSTLEILATDMAKARDNKLKLASSAIQKAARAAINPEQNAKMASGRNLGDSLDLNDPAQRAAYRQHGYWGRLPISDRKTGLRPYAVLTADPRSLSDSNAGRACGAVTMLVIAAGADAAPAIATTAASLAVKVHTEHGYPMPRSVVAAKTCLKLLAEMKTITADEALATLADTIDHPPLRNWITKTLATR